MPRFAFGEPGHCGTVRAHQRGGSWSVVAPSGTSPAEAGQKNACFIFNGGSYLLAHFLAHNRHSEQKRLSQSLKGRKDQMNLPKYKDGSELGPLPRNPSCNSLNDKPPSPALMDA